MLEKVKKEKKGDKEAAATTDAKGKAKAQPVAPGKPATGKSPAEKPVQSAAAAIGARAQAKHDKAEHDSDKAKKKAAGKKPAKKSKK